MVKIKDGIQNGTILKELYKDVQSNKQILEVWRQDELVTKCWNPAETATRNGDVSKIQRMFFVVFAPGKTHLCSTTG